MLNKRYLKLVSPTFRSIFLMKVIARLIRFLKINCAKIHFWITLRSIGVIIFVGIQRKLLSNRCYASSQVRAKFQELVKFCWITAIDTADI